MPQARDARQQLLALADDFPFLEFPRAQSRAQLFDGATQPGGEEEGEAPVRLVNQFFSTSALSKPLSRRAALKSV